MNTVPADEKTTIRYGIDWNALRLEALGLADELDSFALTREKILSQLDPRTAIAARNLSRRVRELAQEFLAGGSVNRRAQALDDLEGIREQALSAVWISPQSTS